MNAVVRPFAGKAPSFADLALDADLDFTHAPACEGTFDVVATGSRRARGGNRAVLVVDGDPAAGERTAALLREAGLHAAVESTPRGAARHMAQLGNPALLLLEVDLPEMSGFEFVERLRHSRRMGDTPVIFFTARASRDDLVRGLQAGSDGYITKSSCPSVLVAAIGKMLGV